MNFASSFAIFKLAKYVHLYWLMRYQLFLLLVIALNINILAQKEIAYPEAFEVFDFYVGHTNAGVFDGVEYYEKYPVRNNKHKFFSSPNFQLGALIYKNEPYFQVPLKYDVYDDVLLARNPAVRTTSITALDSEKIRSFSIDSYRFIRLTESSEKGEELTGFFEILFEKNDLILLKKHRKKMFKKTENGVYYEFKDIPWYVVAYNGVYIRLKNESSLFDLFPNSKELIRNYSRSNSTLKEENYDLFLVSLFRELTN